MAVVTRRASPGPRVLVLRALGLGDLLTALPALRGLRRAYAGHDLAVATHPALAPLFELARLDATVAPARGLEPLPDLPRPALAVNLHGRGPQSHRVLLATRPGRLLAFRHDEIAASNDGPEWDEREHEVARWCRLLRTIDIDTCANDLDLARPAGPAGAAAVGATVLHPGAAAAARRWPVARWAAVARAEYGDGRRVVVTSGPGELGLAREVVGRAGLPPECVVACGHDIRALARTIGAAQRVVSGDTGVAHLATALRRPSVVLFGPTSPARWGPPRDRPWHRVLWAGTESDAHAPTVSPGLARIQPADVLLALRDLPVARPAPIADAA